MRLCKHFQSYGDKRRHDIQPNDTQHNGQNCDSQQIFLTLMVRFVMLIPIMQNVVILRLIVLSVGTLNVVKLCVIAPSKNTSGYKQGHAL